jgi:hypothetical protein
MDMEGSVEPDNPLIVTKRERTGQTAAKASVRVPGGSGAG